MDDKLGFHISNWLISCVTFYERMIAKLLKHLHAPMRDLPDLPTDVFLMITDFLDPIDLVRCRLVSNKWHRTFMNELFLRGVLVMEYGNTPEVHALRKFEVENDDLGQFRDVWRKAFDRVLARKLAIKSGRPRHVRKLDLRNGLKISGKQAGIPDIHFRVTPWSRYLDSRYDPLASEDMWSTSMPTDLLETEWTYDSGLLVYADMTVFQPYVLLDIEQDTIFRVPFAIKDRIVRRVRLKHNLLIFEWAEKGSDDRLNEIEDIHHHYVTVFDVKSRKDSSPWLTQWKITFRNEWRLHDLGLPLCTRDCWFSDHSTTHYAVYFWQMDFSAWGGNDPIESLLIWDISQPSSHRPCNDYSRSSVQVPTAPPLVKKLSYLDLDFLTIRQRDTPFLRKIALDGNACVYFFEEGCIREWGLDVGHGSEAGRRNPADVVWERIVGIPVLGHGPRWEHRLGIDSTSGGEWQHANFKGPDSSMPIRATCWRYAGMEKGIRNQIVRDELAGIIYLVIQRTIGYPEIWVSDSDSWYTQVDLRGIQWKWNAINGDERHLIVSSDKGLHILQFDKERGMRPFLRTAD